LLALQPPPGAEFVAADRVRRRCAFFGPADVEIAADEVDLLPSKVDQLQDP